LLRIVEQDRYQNAGYSIVVPAAAFVVAYSSAHHSPSFVAAGSFLQPVDPYSAASWPEELAGSADSAYTARDYWYLLDVVAHALLPSAVEPDSVAVLDSAVAAFVG